ncbi:MAG: hypothetical protein ACR2HX_18000, partial [Pyrinomonadaceae bacterium]
SQAKKQPDFPTFPQLLLLVKEMAKPDTSLANKTGHFNLLITDWGVLQIGAFCGLVWRWGWVG